MASKSKEQIINSLADHMAFYHSSFPSNPPRSRNPSPSSCLSSRHRSTVLRWFASLPSISDRRAALTVVDASFSFVLLNMLSRLYRSGHGFFFFLNDAAPSSSSTPLPSPANVLFRRSTGLLSRAAESNPFELALGSSLLLFSTSPDKSYCLDAVTVSDDLVADVDHFVDIMDNISGGCFLSGDEDCNILFKPFPELEWLKNKGYYSMEAFAANRIEVMLRVSWLSSCGSGNGGHGGKRGKGGRISMKERAGAVAGVAANTYWRMKGCLDWWARLNKRTRNIIFDAFFGKAARWLTNECIKEPYCGMESSCSFDHELASLLDHPTVWWEAARHSFFRKNRHKTSETSTLQLCVKEPVHILYSKFMHKLLVMQRIALLRLKIVHYEADALFFTSLASAGTPLGYVLMKLQALLVVLAREYTNLEIIGDSKPKILPTKSENKSNANLRHEKKRSNNSRMSQSTSKPSQEHECEHMEHKMKCPVANVSRNIDISVILSENNENKHAPAVPGLDGCKSYSSKKKKKRKGRAATNFSKILNSESKSMNDSIPFVSVVSDTEELATVPPKLSTPLILVGAGLSSACDRDDIVGNEIHNTTELDRPFSSKGSYHGLVGDTLNSIKCTTSYTAHVEERLCSISTSDNTSNDRLNVNSADVHATIMTGQKESSNCSLPLAFHCGSTDNNGEGRCTGCPVGILPPSVGPKLCHDDLLANDSPNKDAYGDHYIYRHRNTMEGTSYEWPSNLPANFLSAVPKPLPAAMDRLHLEAGCRWPGEHALPFISTAHHMRPMALEGGSSQMLQPVALPLSFDWPPICTNYNRSNQNVALRNDSLCATRILSSSWSSFPQGIQPGNDSIDIDRKYCGEHKKSFDFGDDNEGYWYSEEECENNASSGRDYNQHFGGGVMYWNPAEYVGSGYSRPPSHSSDDSAWAWHEAEINRVIDDVGSLPGLSSSYNANGLASPSTSPFGTSSDSFGAPHQAVNYSMGINDSNGNHSNSYSVTECPELSMSTNNSNTEGTMGDSLPYGMLRPIIVPGISCRGSRSEFKLGLDHISPCVPSTRRDLPRIRIRRPPSPVMRCFPQVPRPPPPSPACESKKRGFPIIRSGSSSPRHWAVRSLFPDEKNCEKDPFCLDGPEVVWPPWRTKGLPSVRMVQTIQHSVVEEHLIKISQLSCDQHPDAALPLQPTAASNCSYQESFSSIQNILHEEIDHFYKQVAAGNLIRKPCVNWAVNRVTRCLQVLWPRSRTNVYGSYSTGLALPTSDVDIVVSLPPVRNLEPIKEAGILEGRNGIKETCLQHAARHLANQEWVRSDSLKTVENTAIPIIMLVVEVPFDIMMVNENSVSVDASSEHSSDSVHEQDRVPYIPNINDVSFPSLSKLKTGNSIFLKSIRLDISFQSPSHTGLQTSDLVRDLAQQFPASVPLALVLKKFLADRSLDHSYSGGLSSYCLVLLITRFLQHEHHIGRPMIQNLGGLLMDFLFFFGNVFDPRQMGVSILGSGLYMTREKGTSIDPIHIDDPLCPTNNVGRNCFRIHQCIKAFADAFSILENEVVKFPADFNSSASSFVLLRKIIPSIESNE